MPMRIEGFDGVDRLFDQIGRPQEFCEVAVAEAAPTLLKHTKESVRKAIHNPATERKGEPERTGKLIRSFKVSEAKTNRYGSFCSVGPVGSRKDRNASKGTPLAYAAQAAFLEWGTKQGQAPSPWRARAVKDAEAECAETMQKAFVREVSKVWEVEG